MGNSILYDWIFIVFLFVLLCFSAFFSACEMAFSSANRIKLKALAEKKKRAALALKLLDSYDKILSTALIGSNVVNIVLSSLAAMFFFRLFGARGVSVSTVVVAVLVLLIGDISPKTLAKESPELTALRTAPLLRFFITIFTPLNFLSAAWKKFIVKLFPVKQNRSVTEDELLIFVEEVRNEGGINKQEEHMIRQVIEFDEMTAAEIYIPRVDVSAISLDSTIEEFDRKFAETGFSRLPVFKENIDNITGVILLKDFHHQVMNGKTPGVKTPSEIIKPVVFVTKTIKIAKLLRTLQQKQCHLAVIIDEFGGTLGILTIEDILEQLIGEIWDEHDKVVLEIRKAGDSRYIVMGNVYFKDMVEFIAQENNISKADAIPGTTVGNWITEKLGRLPHIGEGAVWNNLSIKALKIIRHRIMEVVINVNKADENGKE